jgi:hypothetical protein
MQDLNKAVDLIPQKRAISTRRGSQLPTTLLHPFASGSLAATIHINKFIDQP